MKFKYLFALLLVLLSCDDPSLNQQGDDGNTDPVALEDLMQLASIQQAQNTAANITNDITLSYNNKNLITAVTFSNNSNLNYALTYNANNSLSQVIKTENGNVITYDVTYINDAVELTITQAGMNTISKRLFTDQQNRINRILTSEINMTGTSTNIEDVRYLFDANFNVTRVNYIDPATNSILRYSLFTYGANKNPFQDMNDIVQLILFEDYVSYTKSMPIIQEDYLNTILQRRFTHTYTLRDDDFPLSRETITLDGGITTTSFDFFNYRP